MLWCSDTKIAADFASQEVVDVAVTRDRGRLVVRRIRVDAVKLAFAQQIATV